jgi:hypothetical protein
MFALPQLNNLGARHNLKLHDLRMVGSDLRILAKLEQR